MKKIIALYALLLYSCTFLSAQIQFGVKSGLNLSTLKLTHNGEKNSEIFKPRPNALVGLQAKFQFNPQLSYQLEALYLIKGAKQRNVSTDQKIYRWHYLSIPVLVKYNFVPFANVHGGASLDFLLSKRKSFQSTPRLIIPLQLGVGFSITKEFDLAIRYSHGLSKIVNRNDNIPMVGILNSSYYSRVLQLSLHYAIFSKGN